MAPSSCPPYMFEHPRSAFVTFGLREKSFTRVFCDKVPKNTVKWEVFPMPEWYVVSKRPICDRLRTRCPEAALAKRLLVLASFSADKLTFLGSIFLKLGNIIQNLDCCFFSTLPKLSRFFCMLSGISNARFSEIEEEVQYFRELCATHINAFIFSSLYRVLHVRKMQFLMSSVCLVVILIGQERVWF